MSHHTSVCVSVQFPVCLSGSRWAVCRLTGTAGAALLASCCELLLAPLLLLLLLSPFSVSFFTVKITCGRSTAVMDADVLCESLRKLSVRSCNNCVIKHHIQHVCRGGACRGVLVKGILSMSRRLSSAVLCECVCLCVRVCECVLI